MQTAVQEEVKRNEREYHQQMKQQQEKWVHVHMCLYKQNYKWLVPFFLFDSWSICFLIINVFPYTFI
jgi:hypothetical protein